MFQLQKKFRLKPFSGGGASSRLSHPMSFKILFYRYLRLSMNYLTCLWLATPLFRFLIIFHPCVLQNIIKFQYFFLRFILPLIILFVSLFQVVLADSVQNEEYLMKSSEQCENLELQNCDRTKVVGYKEHYHSCSRSSHEIKSS